MIIFLLDLEKRIKRSSKSIRSKQSRNERSTSHKHLEVAMVADDLLVKNHGEKDLDMHLLMLAHLVGKAKELLLIDSKRI